MMTPHECRAFTEVFGWFSGATQSIQLRGGCFRRSSDASLVESMLDEAVEFEEAAAATAVVRAYCTLSSAWVE